MNNLPEMPSIADMIHQLYGTDELDEIMKRHSDNLEDALIDFHRLGTDDPHAKSDYEAKCQAISDATEKLIRKEWQASQPAERAE